MFYTVTIHQQKFIWHHRTQALKYYNYRYLLGSSFLNHKQSIIFLIGLNSKQFISYSCCPHFVLSVISRYDKCTTLLTHIPFQKGHFYHSSILIQCFLFPFHFPKKKNYIFKYWQLFILYFLDPYSMNECRF